MLTLSDSVVIVDRLSVSLWEVVNLYSSMTSLVVLSDSVQLLLPPMRLESHMGGTPKLARRDVPTLRNGLGWRRERV